MKLESQVCSLDLAKRLKELGEKQESLFYWHPNAADDNWKLVDNDTPLRFPEDTVSAFTVAELGEMLPYFLDMQYPTAYLHTVKIAESQYRSCYVNGSGVVAKDGFRLQYVADTEADAHAKMLIYLLENRLISAGAKG